MDTKALQPGQLSPAAIKELLDSKEKLTEFSTTALIHAITAGLIRSKDEKTPPSAVAQLIDQLRKVRADLTGDNHQAAMPQMLVNIQFGQSQQPVPVAIEVQSNRVVDAIDDLTALDMDLLETTGAIIDASNIAEEPEYDLD